MLEGSSLCKFSEESQAQQNDDLVPQCHYKIVEQTIIVLSQKTFLIRSNLYYELNLEYIRFILPFVNKHT